MTISAKWTSKFCKLVVFVWGGSGGPLAIDGFSSERASNTESVSMSLLHHDWRYCCVCLSHYNFWVESDLILRLERINVVFIWMTLYLLLDIRRTWIKRVQSDRPYVIYLYMPASATVAGIWYFPSCYDHDRFILLPSVFIRYCLSNPSIFTTYIAQVAWAWKLRNVFIYYL